MDVDNVGHFMSSLSEKPAVIIPAYNESTVILKLLNSLNEGFSSGHYAVVVACNGCTDDTVELVETNFPDYICLDIQKASKTNALNQAESLGLGFPRIYVDADVDICTDSVLQLINSLKQIDEPVLAAPRGKINCEKSDSFVRLFYAAWQKTIFFIEQGYGSGVYGLNQPARDLFDTFPDITSDDGFVRQLSPDQQIKIVESATSAVKAPRTISDLVKIKVRIKSGKSELESLSRISSQGSSKGRFVLKPALSEYLLYVLINLYIWGRVRFERKHGSGFKWHRDESSR